MIVYELVFKSFCSKGDDDYLETWAHEVDALTDDGWMVVDCRRQSRGRGSWVTVLSRPEEKVYSSEIEDGDPEDWGEQ